MERKCIHQNCICFPILYIELGFMFSDLKKECTLEAPVMIIELNDYLSLLCLLLLLLLNINMDYIILLQGLALFSERKGAQFALTISIGMKVSHGSIAKKCIAFYFPQVMILH